MPEPGLVSWNTLIGAYALEGHAAEAISLFHEMQGFGIGANDVVFVATLTACSHLGLLDMARDYFFSMIRDHWITPIPEHYVCMVDILGRAGKLAEAQELADGMPFPPDPATWRSIVGSCQIHSEATLAARAAERLDPGTSDPYVLLRNININE
ncbi:hypothetical protein SELMODRAFT_127538 [Selaginella moellendorffii]|uniref:Pentacotripeptide-repeat region of PRORP domain-containing protein n=3 Tax=Selaginella moellendorffii TaxID=88036 RepID=D8SY04_SELML|nr:hypothetical protein SELMODRAFT_127538 [Selaginella moellendorffii]